MCAAVAGKRGRRVAVLEGCNRVGKKILMSGGGRCNFTNLHCSPAEYTSANPHFCKSALSRYTQWDFVALVEEHGIPYHEKTAGQLFCDVSSKDIVRMLERECAEAGVSIVTDCDVASVTCDGHYTAISSAGEFSAESLVVATGGLSIPRMGATDFGYRLARQFGVKILETRAGLVPFTFSGAMHELTTRLSGVSVDATVTTNRASFTESILFTHRGLSGPAALQASSYWLPGEKLIIDLFPGRNCCDLLLEAKRDKPAALLRTVLAEHLPKALVLELQSLLWAPDAEKPLQEFADESLRLLGREMQAWALKPAATEGYRTAEVTLGGVDTDELSSKTMESRRQPGLYFVGEVVDVTGHLGGYNFQWAWASGRAAGMVA